MSSFATGRNYHEEIEYSTFHFDPDLPHPPGLHTQANRRADIDRNEHPDDPIADGYRTPLPDRLCYSPSTPVHYLKTKR